MKIFRLITLFILSSIIYFPFSVGAQTAASNEEIIPNVITRIEDESEGNIMFVIPENILDKILNDFDTGRRNNNQRENIRPGINRLQGFRIQVFSDGRNQHSLESRAKARGNAIVAKFPKYRGQVYTFSSSPNWYTRIGNFRTMAEATNALDELKRAFPSFAPEMRVVRSKIIVIR